MSVFESTHGRLHPAQPEELSLVRSEVEELARSTHFAGSKRYPAFLRYVVEKTLAGKADELKERIIGIEVFHRPPNYDTTSDTVVRVTAGEVRKRLALTYHENGGAHPLQIVLPAGTYVPEFYLQRQPDLALQVGGPAVEVGADVLAGADAQPASVTETDLLLSQQAASGLPQLAAMPPDSTAPVRSGRMLPWIALAALVGLGTGLALAPYRIALRQLPIDRFWHAVEVSGTPVLFCAGSLVPTAAGGAGFTEANKFDDYPYISLATASALSAVGNRLSGRGIPYLVQPSSSSSLTDMRQHPTILVGAYDNRWTILVSKELRYQFADKPTIAIYDSKNPSRIWKRLDALPYKDKDDYAILARFHDHVTDSDTVILAGLGKNGTEAAAQFATTPKYLEELERQAGKAWESRNVELVLKAAVVDGKTGTPSIEAVEVW